MRGFLKLFRPQKLVYMCVCVSAPRLLITSHVKGTHNNQIMKFYGYSVSLYYTAIDKLYSHGLSKTSGHKYLPKKTKVMRY